MARTARLTPQELQDFALSQLPASGEIEYSELYNKIRASDNPEAASMLPELKRQGLVTAKVEATPTGIKHTYSKKVS